MNIQHVYDRFGEKIHNYLTIKLGYSSDAEDILQEVFCRLVRYSLRFRFARNPVSFVFKIARNEANRFLRKKIRDQQGCRQIPDLHDVIQGALSGPSPRDEETAARALAQIPDEQREVIILRFFEELTFREIASV